MREYDRVMRGYLGSGSRRDFLRWGGGSAAALLLSGLEARRADASVRLSSYPFTLGVASGDPTPTGVVLWTRLAPEPLLGGGMPARRVPVRWEMSEDESFRRVVKQGDVLAVPELGHSVHVEVEGLRSGRTYWYRFLSGGEASPTGRTRTAPAVGASPAQLAFAFVSCQNYQAGYYTAHRHLAGEDLDLVIHLGDYIYEGGVARNTPRRHNSAEIRTLDDYRNRYALYKSDPDLKAAHATFPFVVTWDDHEVDNNYAGSTSEDHVPVEEFLRRRAAAYQAYYESMPLRRSSMPQGSDLRLFRRFAYGDLAAFHVLDTRQHRTDQPCGDGFHPTCEAAEDPAATILGAEQEAWLLDGLGRSRQRWNVLANQVPISPILRTRGELQGHQMDKWDGYVSVRERVLDFVRDRQVSNPVVITGDVHVNWVADIVADRRDPTSQAIGTEFVGTSISSGGDGSAMTADGTAMLSDNPHMRYFNAQRGYVRATLTPSTWVSDYRVIPYVATTGAPVRTDASFTIESGSRGVHRS